MRSIDDDLSSQLQAKKSFYDALYSIDDTDSDDDAGMVESTVVMGRGSKRKRDSGNRKSSGTPRPEHSANAPVVLPLDSSLPERQSITVNAGDSAPVVMASKPEMLVDDHKALETRAGSKTIQPKHDRSSRKLFDGLCFYFYPNEKCGPRKFRMDLALKHGARCAMVMSGAVTHLVVDSGLLCGDVVKVLGSLPPDIHMVDQSWVADCIQWGTGTLDTSRPQYRVRGSETGPPAPRRLDSPLKLKPAKKDVLVQPLQTPSQNTNSTVSDPSPIRSILQTAAPAEADITGSKGDDLEGFIAMAKGNVFLDDDDQSGSDADGSGEDAYATKTPNWQKKFQCMESHTGKSATNGPNAYTITKLQEMQQYYEKVQDTWRPIAYRKAIASLRKPTVKITTYEEAKKLQGVGTRLAKKIEEIAITGRLMRLENTEDDPTDKVLKLFLGVYGIGYGRAMKLIIQGFTSLEDLRTKAKLDGTQVIGLEHYDDFNSRIPRAEVLQHAEIVAKAVSRLSAEVKVIPMGSYRRGAADSGDIDLIVTHPDWNLSQLRSMATEKLVPNLFETGFLKCGLATTSREDGSKWHGASCLPGSKVWRRIDFLLVPGEELPAALIYFTGNDLFNRSMRLLASKKKMRLNQRGLYEDVMRGQGRTKITEGRAMPAKTERDIFRILGVPWREPHERVIS